MVRGGRRAGSDPPLPQGNQLQLNAAFGVVALRAEPVPVVELFERLGVALPSRVAVGPGTEALVARDEQARGSGVGGDVRGAVAPAGAGTGNVGEEVVEAGLRGGGGGGGVKGGERVAIRVDPDVVRAAQVFEHVDFGGVRAVAPRMLGNAKNAHGHVLCVLLRVAGMTFSWKGA